MPAPARGAAAACRRAHQPHASRTVRWNPEAPGRGKSPAARRIRHLGGQGHATAHPEAQSSGSYPAAFRGRRRQRAGRIRRAPPRSRGGALSTVGGSSAAAGLQIPLAGQPLGRATHNGGDRWPAGASRPYHSAAPCEGGAHGARAVRAATVAQAWRCAARSPALGSATKVTRIALA